jgi:hypothetical protein
VLRSNFESCRRGGTSEVDKIELNLRATFSSRLLSESARLSCQARALQAESMVLWRHKKMRHRSVDAVATIRPFVSGFFTLTFGNLTRQSQLPKNKKEMELSDLYWEPQESGFCGVHCVNNLLQGAYFTEIDLAQIGEFLLLSCPHLYLHNLDLCS